MADVSSPKEFLTELLMTVDALDADKSELDGLLSAKKQLEGALDSLTKNTEKEKISMVRSRREDIAAGFDRQIKAAKSEVRTAGSRRQKALNEGMDKKAKEATKDVRGENEGHRETLKTYVRNHKLPPVFKSRFYYALFCPGIIGYVILAALFCIIMGISGAMITRSAAASASIAPWVFMGIIAIVLAFAYIIIWANTRIRYRDEIKSCLNIIKSIRKNEKQARKIERSIKKAGDDDSYDLHEYDEALKEKQTKLEEAEEARKQALLKFDEDTALKLKEEIEARHAEEKTSLKDRISANEAEINSAKERIRASENEINSRFISYVGAANIDHDRVAAMIKLIDEGTAGTVSEAVAKLDEK